MVAFVGGAPLGVNARVSRGSVASRSSGFVAAIAARRATLATPAVAPQRTGAISMATAGAMVSCPGATGMHENATISAETSQALITKDISPRPVIIGVAADSGCGKSTFLRRVSDIFGTKISNSHTPSGELLTVICLDDFHVHDRQGRREAKVTALDAAANNFDLMYEQVKALKEGKSIMKPVYNHETGEIDPPELIEPNHIIVIEGLHPIYDQRVKDLLDYSIYLDVADEVKLTWKVQRDMAERGHSYESILASIEARVPDFKEFIEPQKFEADCILNILPTKLVPDDKENSILRVQMIQKEEETELNNVYLYDEGSTIDWVPCGRKLTCSYPGIKFHYGPETYGDHEVSVVEVDGNFEKLEEMIYVESHLNNTGTKFYGEITQSLLRNPNAPGSGNGTGLFQVLLALKMRETYERVTGKVVSSSS